MIPNNFYRTSIKALILDEQKKFLLFLEDTGLWELPGGGVEFGETPQECVKRELQEEAGLEVLHVKHQPSYFLTGQYLGKNWKSLVIYETVIKNVQFTPTDECTQIQFFSRAEALKVNLHPSVRKFVEEYVPELEFTQLLEELRTDLESSNEGEDVLAKKAFANLTSQQLFDQLASTIFHSDMTSSETAFILLQRLPFAQKLTPEIAEFRKVLYEEKKLSHLAGALLESADRRLVSCAVSLISEHALEELNGKVLEKFYFFLSKKDWFITHRILVDFFHFVRRDNPKKFISAICETDDEILTGRVLYELLSDEDQTIDQLSKELETERFPELHKILLNRTTSTEERLTLLFPFWKQFSELK